MTRLDALRALLAQADPEDLPARTHARTQEPEPEKLTLSYVLRVFGRRVA